MNTRCQAIVATPIGCSFGYLGLFSDRQGICGIEFFCDSTQPASSNADKCVLANQAKAELKRYFEQPYWVFSVPLHLIGTDFQQRVWQYLRSIPAGQVRTYGDIAKVLGTSPRAVGNACRANPLPIIIPCHRVVGANGPGGYSGQTRGKEMAIKHWLLKHEGVVYPA